MGAPYIYDISPLRLKRSHDTEYHTMNTWLLQFIYFYTYKKPSRHHLSKHVLILLLYWAKLEGNEIACVTYCNQYVASEWVKLHRQIETRCTSIFRLLKQRIATWGMSNLSIGFWTPIHRCSGEGTTDEGYVLRRKSFGILGRKTQHAGRRKFVQGLSSHKFELMKYMNVLQVKILVVDLDLRNI